MREGKIEKIKEGENSVFERIRKFKEKEIGKGPNQWKTIEPELLLPEAIKIFEFIEKQEFEAAKPGLEFLRQEIKKTRDKNSKATNEAFLAYFDDKTIKMMSDKETTEFNAKDNV